MLTFLKQTTHSIMGNGGLTSDKKPNESNNEEQEHLKASHGCKKNPGLIFFACTDKGPVITDILEERGWSRTKDRNVTNFTIKWCLEHQVDWIKFEEGKQLINNIPGQITFADKVNLWNTMRDYIHQRRSNDGVNIYTFLPMTFVLDDESEVTEFLRTYKRQNRTWICKPRYSYAGRGIYVISVNSDLNTIFKFKLGTNNRMLQQPKLPGYLMQEYIARPLLIKGRKFDIRVHWLVAWTKPLLVFYNHNASVVRLSLNLYREFDFDRATHLTNLSVQENHYRYAFSQEATGMTMQQLNNYFNQCFRPFNPKMCQDWVMKVMQSRMQTIIRHVVRASKDKLTRTAGHFGLFGCDFLLDENFRIWLLEINDNPGVGWGNTRVNTTTKPLFEETLDIVFECFEKYKKGRPLLPVECLKNYQLIYNENDDQDLLMQDENQTSIDRNSARFSMREGPSRASNNARTLPRLNTARTSQTLNETSGSQSDINVPLTSVSNLHLSSLTPTDDSSKTIESFRHQDDIELERLLKSRTIKQTRTKFSLPTPPTPTTSRSLPRTNVTSKTNLSIKRSFSVNSTPTIIRKKRIDLIPVTTMKKGNIIKRMNIISSRNEINKTIINITPVTEMIIEEEEKENQEQNQPIVTINSNSDDLLTPQACAVL